MPTKLINSVILMQNIFNHLLGFRGMRTWLCVDATKTVIFVGVLLSELVVVVAELSQKRTESLVF